MYVPKNFYFHSKKDYTKVKLLTDQELKLATELKFKGYNVCLQHPVSRMHVDIGICQNNGAKILIEVDDDTHDQEKDKNRMYTCAVEGYFTIRVTNSDVDENFERTIIKLQLFIDHYTKAWEIYNDEAQNGIIQYEAPVDSIDHLSHVH
ncbi:DUF559 domain-containing protein [Halobacillus litoralis]|uniref:DUF559 domain-containing protein n=1 Tax=Halobacillus litoralis TaxID=45668 RepID=UPI001CD49D8F|nr:DUF559 domain-containing protein [Halobacillus litoralis]MCA1022142.1 DUF559 domain-containing protein [Halobacillus litoralis]